MRIFKVIECIRLFAAIRNDKRGVTAVEYGIMASLIAVAIITAVTLVGTKLNTTFGHISTALT